MSFISSLIKVSTSILVAKLFFTTKLAKTFESYFLALKRPNQSIGKYNDF